MPARPSSTAAAATTSLTFETISGPTTANGGNESDTFNVGSNAAGTIANPNVNTGGNLQGIGDDSGDSLMINGNDPTSGSDWLYVDDSGDTEANIGDADVNDDQRPWS